MFQGQISKISRRLRSTLSITALVLMAFAAIACNQENTSQISSPPQSKQAQQATSSQETQLKPKIVATFLPIYWFTKAVAMEAAQVDILIPPGTEVHEYQATPDNVKAIASSQVLVKNGLGLEEFLSATVKNAQNQKLTQIDASKGIQPLGEISTVEKAGGKDHDHDRTEGNPHVWLDPVFAKQQVINIRDGLIAADGANKATYEANAAAYIKQLDALDAEYKQTLQKYPNCTFITFHDAYPYLAKRYNLKQVAVVEIPEDQLAPGDVQKAVQAVKKYKVKALFGEPGIDNKLLTSLSQDLKLTLRELDSLENGSRDPQDYFTAMRANLQTLEAGCKSS